MNTRNEIFKRSQERQGKAKARAGAVTGVVSLFDGRLSGEKLPVLAFLP